MDGMKRGRSEWKKERKKNMISKIKTKEKKIDVNLIFVLKSISG